MDFNQKLQQLRKQKNLTQEDLAEKLFVSRTAISKWESGKGYPSIDSLKEISRFFNVTIDDMICGEEIVVLAESDIKAKSEKSIAIILAILDCMAIAMVFLPFFGQQGANQIDLVSLISLSDISLWQKTVFIVITTLTVLNGFSALIICNFDKPEWNKHRLITGGVLTALSTLFFMISAEPYAGAFCLIILIVKGFFIIKNK